MEKSLLPLLKGEKIRDHIFMEHTGFQRAIRTEEWKFIGNFPPPLPDAGWIGWIDGRIDGVSVYKRPSELYNVKEDPMETINLMEKEKEKALELKQILHEWIWKNLKEGEEDPMFAQRKETFFRHTRQDYFGKIMKLYESLGLK